MPSLITIDDLCGLSGLPTSASGVSRWLQKRSISPVVSERPSGRNRYALAELSEHLSGAEMHSLQLRLDRVREDDPDLIAARRRFQEASRETREDADSKERILIEVELMISSGEGITRAIEAAAARHDLSVSAIEKWRRQVQGLPRGDWKFVLCHKSTGSSRRRFTLDHPFVKVFFDRYWLRRSQPPTRAAYRRMLKDLEKGRLAIEVDPGDYPSCETLRLLVQQKLRPGMVALSRVGPTAQRRTQLYQTRDRSGLSPYQIVTGDGHKANFLVEASDGSRYRPEIITMVDEYSGYTLAWEIDRVENAGAVRRCVAKTLLEYGKPDTFKFDNGCGFIQKELTAGAAGKRWVGKDRPGEAPGAIVRHGINVEWFPPGAAESKGRHERSFGPLEDALQADPKIPEGSYLGTSPTTRPEDGGSVVMSEAVFEQAVAEAVDLINDRESEGANCRGRSPRETFHEDGYNRGLRHHVSAMEATLFLLPAKIRTPRKAGEIHLNKNVYWDASTAEKIRAATSPEKRRVLVYYDPNPAGLHNQIWVHSLLPQTPEGEVLEDRYLGAMPCQDPSGYSDVDAVRVSKRLRAQARQEDRQQRERLRVLEEISPRKDREHDQALAKLRQIPLPDAEESPAPEVDWASVWEDAETSGESSSTNLPKRRVG